MTFYQLRNINEENLTANENNDEVETCNTGETFKIEEVYVNNELTFKNAKEKNSLTVNKTMFMLR